MPRGARLAAVAAVLAGLVLLGVWLGARGGVVARLVAGRRTSIEHSVAVERLRAVARLVTSETGVRDVVTYRSTWLGSTKRALVVVSGRVSAGIDLEAGTEVDIDAAARRITLTLPHARVLAVEVTELRTYDERSGLWNPFRPSDRDSVFAAARHQLVATAGELGLVPHAEQSAVRLLEGLFAADGYATAVVFRP